MHSINTVLLQLFATLMVHDQSFSVGEVVFVDEDGSMHNKILTEEACYTKFSGTDDVYEAALRVPLSVQCKCQGCSSSSTTKHAICFRKLNGKYLLVQPVEYVSFSPWGIVTRMQRGWLNDNSEGVPGCAPRTRDVTPYIHLTSDEELVRKVVDKRHVDAALTELEAYNRTTRVGNEFFVPTHFLDDRKLYN